MILLAPDEQALVVVEADEGQREAAARQREAVKRQVDGDDQREDRKTEEDDHRRQHHDAAGMAVDPFVASLARVDQIRRCLSCSHVSLGVSGSRRAAPANDADGWRLPGAPRRAGKEASLSALDAERALVELELALDPDLLVELVPAVKHGLDRLLLIDFTRQEARDRLVEHDLLILLVLRDAQVEDHVRAVETVLDRAKIAVSGHLA